MGTSVWLIFPLPTLSDAWQYYRYLHKVKLLIFKGTRPFRYRTCESVSQSVIQSVGHKKVWNSTINLTYLAMVLYGTKWSFIVPYGPLLTRMVQLSPVWSQMVSSCTMWYCMVLYCTVWSPMDPYGPLRSHMVPLVLYDTIWYNQLPYCLYGLVGSHMASYGWYGPAWPLTVLYFPVWFEGSHMVHYSPL